ncbi:GH39 family glycosyl hydrolase [Paenibacillus mendelii]|uniref:Glycosyl hydrolases family 39 N-terminal catalytic domain-containing protein n=1 Tax=Paenibacillus mendelii TaxID=206163 RepID=A0ABV6JHU0_9BACL|nr:hypothetical protein [Paenibacillus mendelii]MCQ6558331.1 hypothetical protein [Paenibacillus mendelii]
MWGFKQISLGIAAVIIIISTVVAAINFRAGGDKSMEAPKKAPVQAPEDASGTKPADPPQDKAAVRIDLSKLGDPLENKFTDLNQWDLQMDWADSAKGRPSDYIRTHYPFVKRVQFMTATGGTDNIDLFEDPADRENLTDYNFSRLTDALQHVIDQGLKPYIVTGNVPLKYSSVPHIGSFGVNVRPPQDYDVYYRYMKAMADEIVSRFGLNEVRTWTWRVLTEYENGDWFNNLSPESSMEAYFKLYDYTVAALEASIGAENLYIGAHSMTNGEGLWDERSFIDHVASGTNYYTGKKGTQLDFLSFSYYDNFPGMLSGNSLEQNMRLLRDRAEANGLSDLKYGVEEGRILAGSDRKELFPRTVASSFQSSSDAKLFKHMHDIDLDYFSTWYLNTERIWGESAGVDPVGTHLANLVYRMEGASRAAVQVSGSTVNTSNEVDGIGGYQASSNTAQFLIYNYNLDQKADVSEPVTIILDNVEAVSGDKVAVKQWIIDDEHGNFWPAWQAYLEEQGATSNQFGNWSVDSWTAGSNLTDEKLRQYWYDHVKEYQGLAKLEPDETTAVIKDNQLRFTPTLAPHAVMYYEITGVRPSAKQSISEVSDRP